MIQLQKVSKDFFLKVFIRRWKQEEDVFNIILHWIDHNKSERKKYFANFFRHVGLIYVSRDYLLNDIVTNDLVNDNACCLELVKAAMKAIDSKNCENVSFPPPRKSLETPVIVMVDEGFDIKEKVQKLLTDSGYDKKRARTMDMDDFLGLLHLFNSNGVHFT
ncbi:hypothetical protein ACROYT_G044628 [Oculina patagonica]